MWVVYMTSVRLDLLQLGLFYRKLPAHADKPNKKAPAIAVNLYLIILITTIYIKNR